MPSVLRNIAAVVVGYIVMAVIVMVTFFLAYTALGPDTTYKPGTYEVSLLWIGIMLVFGAAAAIAGGVTCAKIASSRRGAAAALAVLVGFLGALQLVGAIMAPEPEDTARPDEVSIAEAMQNARPSIWYAALNPIVGIAGVLIGAHLVAPRYPDTPANPDPNE